MSFEGVGILGRRHGRPPVAGKPSFLDRSSSGEGRQGEHKGDSGETHVGSLGWSIIGSRRLGRFRRSSFRFGVVDLVVNRQNNRRKGLVQKVFGMYSRSNVRPRKYALAPKTLK